MKNTLINIHRILFILMVLSLILPVMVVESSTPAYSFETISPVLQTHLFSLEPFSLYLPFLSKEPSGPPLMLGISPKGYFGPDSQSTVDALLIAADAWAGKRHTIVGTFINLEDVNPTYNFKGQLEMLWSNGYVAFFNLSSTRTAAQIAGGTIDTAIRAMGTAYASWIALGGGRKAFLAPLQEMNGYWTSYGEDPTNFKIAYDRIRNLFAEQGAPLNSAWWTFAPNGWSEPEQNFELYYPGDSKVDAIGFSSYNYGYCPIASPWEKWEDYTTLYLPYLDRMRIMAPSKPIIIAQTASSAQYPLGGIFDHAKKDQWIINQYTYLASRYGVIAILYFDMDLSYECDWAIFNTTNKFYGYLTAAAIPRFVYIEPARLSAMDLHVP